MTFSYHILMLIYGSVRDDPRVINEGRSLTESSYQVTVIGAPREGYNSEPTRTTIDGMTVILVPLLTKLNITQFTKMIKRLWQADLGEMTEIMPHGTSSIRTFLNIIVFWLWTLRLGWVTRYDMVHCHDVMPLPTGWLLARRYASKFIYDSHEPWQFRGKGKYRIFAIIDGIFLPWADGVIITSEPLRPHIVDAGGVHITNVANYKRLDQYNVDEDSVQAVIEDLGLAQYKLVIIYIGFLFAHRGVVELAQAVAQDEEVGLIVAGRGDSTPEIEKIAAQYPNIHWLGWMRLDDVPVYTRAADVIYCWLPDEPDMQVCTPNKLFDSIASGRAIIAHKGVGEMSTLIEKHGFGYLVDNHSVASLTEAFDELKNPDVRIAMQQKAANLQDTFNWKTSEHRLLDLYGTLLQDQNPDA